MRNLHCVDAEHDTTALVRSTTRWWATAAGVLYDGDAGHGYPRCRAQAARHRLFLLLRTNRLMVRRRSIRVSARAPREVAIERGGFERRSIYCAVALVRVLGYSASQAGWHCGGSAGRDPDFCARPGRCRCGGRRPSARALTMPSSADDASSCCKLLRLLPPQSALCLGRDDATTLPPSARPILTPRRTISPLVSDVVAKAELAENGPVRGTMVIRPYGYAVWERMQAAMDERIKAAGAVNVYFPLFIPESFLRKEAEHVEGFSPELAVVTHAGGKELDEPVVVRPTSETLFNTYFTKWIQSYRDLPLLLNQWANVVRWELRPRVFLRTTEFLWQEGHTAHATESDAREYALKILHEVYEDFMVEVLAIPVHIGAKTRKERFAGATFTYCLEGMMGDGKALQMGTSHELGQNFARAFDTTYLDDKGEQQLVWTTSWGTSTRMVGGLIMAHGDDNGLRVPPSLAPHQVVVLLVRDEPESAAAAERLTRELRDNGIRVELDKKVSASFGRRVTDWEIKGVPLRIEVGPRDLRTGGHVAPRDTARSRGAPASSQSGRGRPRGHQRFMFAKPWRRDARTVGRVGRRGVEAARRVRSQSVGKVGEEGETELNRHAVSVLLQRADGQVRRLRTSRARGHRRRLLTPGS